MRRVLAAGALAAVAAGWAPVRPLAAQSVRVDAPTGTVLPSITPSLVVHATGFGSNLPLQVTLQMATAADFTGLVIDSTFTSADSTVTVVPSRPLPSEVAVWWRVRVRGANGATVESPVTGPRTVPAWLRLLTPNSANGSSLDERRPSFVWQAAPVAPAVGTWEFELEITTPNGGALFATGLRDTTFRPPVDLQANTSYRWNVRATLRPGGSIRVYSLGSFVITDPPLPTTTLLFQNFPNPFPSPTASTTCFWFDVGEPGATVSLDVLDLRGTVVRTIVPAADGITRFAPGRYGRGVPGATSNCDGNFTWDGTANDGRVVAPGVYLARFIADGGRPTFRRIVFRGR